MRIEKFNSKSKMFEENIVYKPFHYDWAIEIDKRHEAAHWIEDEIPLGDDVTQWKNNKITSDEKDFVTNVLKLFTTMDVVVSRNYYRQLIPNFLNNEITNMLGGFAAREKIHQRAYALLNDTLGIPESEYSAFLQYKELHDKVDFAMESDQEDVSNLALTLAKSVFNEGVSLFSSFVMLLNFQRFGKMMGLGKIIEWSIRDESLTLDTEVLTPDGWIEISKIQEGDLILEWNMETQEMSFQPIQTIKDVKRDITYIYEGDNFHQHVSGGHRMIIEQDNKITESTGAELNVQDDFNFIVSGIKIGDDTLDDVTKDRIKNSIDNNTSMEWVYELLPSKSSKWANDFLEFYHSLESGDLI